MAAAAFKSLTRTTASLLKAHIVSRTDLPTSESCTMNIHDYTAFGITAQICPEGKTSDCLATKATMFGEAKHQYLHSSHVYICHVCTGITYLCRVLKAAC